MFIKINNGNYINVNRITSMYAIGSGSSWTIDVASGDAGETTLGTIDTPVFTTEAKAQQFIQQILGGFDANSLIDL